MLPGVKLVYNYERTFCLVYTIAVNNSRDPRLSFTYNLYEILAPSLISRESAKDSRGIKQATV